jgi:hypothetical protein
VLLVASLVRLPAISRPLLGYFGAKNVVYAMIARNWIEGRASLWRPTLDCLAGGERAWHLLEFPVSAYLAGAAWGVFGGSLDAWGRLVSAVFSLGGVALMFALVRRWHGPAAAYGAGTMLALSPVAIIFGQSFMLEASLVFFTLASFWCLDCWLATDRKRWLLAASVVFALLLLTKIYMLAMVLPLAALVWRTLRGRGRLANGRIWGEFILAGILASAPAAAWYAHAWQAASPEQATSARVFYSIRHSAAVHRWPHPLLASPEFYKRQMDDLSGIMLTPIGLALALAGACNPGWRRHAPWLAATAILIAALPAKFHELSYYDFVILPAGCVLVGLGWQIVYERMRPGRLGIAGVMVVGLAFSMRYAARPAFTTPAEDRDVLAAAAAVQELTTGGEPVATLHGAGMDLLYYCNRTGWAYSVNDRRLADKLQAAREQGARWLAVADLKSAAESPSASAALEGLPVVRSGRDFKIYDLAFNSAGSLFHADRRPAGPTR